MAENIEQSEIVKEFAVVKENIKEKLIALETYKIMYDSIKYECKICLRLFNIDDLKRDEGTDCLRCPACYCASFKIKKIK